MANNRIYIRCKGCGATLFLGKTFGGYYWENYYGEGVHLEDRLNEFFDKHTYCSEPKVEPPLPYDAFLFPLPEDCEGCEGAFDIVYENNYGTGIIDPRYDRERRSDETETD